MSGAISQRLSWMFNAEVADMGLPVFTEFNTPRAGRFTVMLARIFGVKQVASCAGCTVTMYKWRGKQYVVGCRHK